MDPYKKIMCKYKINSREEARKFILKNHPDKGSGFNQSDFKIILDAYKNNIYCYNDKNKKDYKNSKITKKIREKIFTNMRKTANFSKIYVNDKFDKSRFDPSHFNNNINNTSPKIVQLLNNINKLDEIDMKNHGKKFKHFIFSDVKDGGYGAKIISSALIANGFNNVIKARKIPNQSKLKLYIDISKKNNFGLLCSNSIYGSTFNEKIKKQLLTIYNSRPDNINGEKIRLIVFDSGFKEGIDLFDVKYVHIFEPSMTIADLKQTIGRATRTCGQKGLEFQPNIGWPLYVYNYYLTVPEITQNTFSASHFITNNINNPKENESDHDVFIFKDIDKFNDATMLYSNFDKAMNNLTSQLFDIGPSLAVDYLLTKNLHNIDDLNYEFMEKDLYLMGGTKSVHASINKNSKFYKLDVINCKGKCGKRTSTDVPVSLDFLRKVYHKYGHPKKTLPKKNQREYFCYFMKNPFIGYIFCKQLNLEWSQRYAYVPEIVEKKKKIEKIKENLDNLDLNTDDNSVLENADYDILNYSGKNISSNNTVPSTKLNFIKMRDFIKSNYYNKNFIWDKIEVVNKCVSNTSNEQKSYKIDLNPTQKFITKYFSPLSPYKGLLLWHSVGTGKTCSGVSIASEFEKYDYNILWVTRTTLKSDVWKNIFDQICHSIILREVENGKKLPENLTERKKMLSKLWLEPLSYKQFSNLLSGKNKIYDELKLRNGEDDILKKTLIIIDEAHKLYGGDLKAIERPDTNVMEKLIMNSYNKSGTDSCKLLIMTATPFTNSPLELFKLTNLFMTNESEKITTDNDEFKKQYMTSDNILSQNGVKNIANKLSGYISYLNREKDPTQFAQPIMINVPVLMSNIDDEYRNYIFLKQKLDNIDNLSNITIEFIRNKIKNAKELIKSYKSDIKYNNDKIKKECNKLSSNEKHDCILKYSTIVREINVKLGMQLIRLTKFEKDLDENLAIKNSKKEYYNTLKTKLKKLKDSYIQEYELYKRLKEFLKYTPSSKLNKAKTLSISKNKDKNKNSSRKFKTI